jgi:CHAT domain-containing protein
MSTRGSPGTLGLLSFHVNERETLVISADNSSVEPRVDPVTVTAAEITDAARQLRDLFSPVNINFRRPEQTTDMAWLGPLGHTLLAPVVELLRRSSQLVVAPHFDLHSLPLHLLAPSGGEPLGTTHSVSYVPNLSMYAALLERGGADTTEFTTRSFCLATAAAEDSDRVSKDFLIAPRAFADATGGELRCGPEATRTEFRAHASKAAMVYLSCHGRFDVTDSLESSLLLSDGETLPSRVAKNDPSHALSVRDILGLNIHAPLVVLDACMSGMQHIAPGDEPMGFPTALLLAGAGAVIASTWTVEQNLARDFMLALLAKWSADGSLGEAMHYAVTTIRSDYPHPFHWGVFSLVGNDRLLFPKGGAQ